MMSAKNGDHVFCNEEGDVFKLRGGKLVVEVEADAGFGAIEIELPPRETERLYKAMHLHYERVNK